MSYLNSFKRFILLSLSLLGLSIAPSNADTVSYFGVADNSPIVPYFDPSIGTLNSVNIDYTIIGQVSVSGNVVGAVSDGELFGAVSGGLLKTSAPGIAVGPNIGDFNGAVPIDPSSGLFAGELLPFEVLSPTGGFTFIGANTLPFIGTSSFGLLGFADVFSCEGVISAFTATIVDSCFIDSFLPVFDLTYDFTAASIPPPMPPVPIPAAIWLFGTALIGLIGFSKRRKAA